MKKLSVIYAGWGEDWSLGTLADDGRTLLFEYSSEALEQGLDLSPINLKLSPRTYGGFPDFQMRLPGLFADSLPDGWGLLLMDRLFRQRGIRNPGPLDRLAFIGDRAIGALRYAPPDKTALPVADLDLLSLARESGRVLAGEAGDVLRELVLIGGSPQGARPKALVQYDRASGSVSTLPDARGEPWLVKFPAQNEHKETCAVEAFYMELAVACGLNVPESRWFDLAPDVAAFGVARFDRECGMRVPVHSLAGLLHADFRVPGSADYTSLLRATRLLTRDQREVEQAFARAVFNVVFDNLDDHPKNFAWRLGQDRRWRLAPAYDLTFSSGPGGQHHMDVCGKGNRIRLADLLQLAKEGDVPEGAAREVVQKVVAVAATITKLASDFPIRRQTIRDMSGIIAANCAQLR